MQLIRELHMYPPNFIAFEYATMMAVPKLFYLLFRNIESVKSKFSENNFGFY